MKSILIALAPLSLLVVACSSSPTQGADPSDGGDTGDHASLPEASTGGDALGGGHLPPDMSKSCTGKGGCLADEYCAIRAGAACTAEGLCAKAEVACDGAITAAGICGCDGKSYGNDCLAERAGVTPEKSGACSGGTSEQPCTGNGGCNAGEYCAIKAGAACTAEGTCVKTATACDGAITAAGVCGCDGKKYGNDCLAEKAGVTPEKSGPCG